MKKPLPEPPIPLPSMSAMDWSQQIYDWMKEVRDTLEAERQDNLRNLVRQIKAVKDESSGLQQTTSEET